MGMNSDVSFEDGIKVLTYILISAILFVAFYFTTFKLNVEIEIMALMLIGYTLFLVLPFSSGKMGLSGFEFELKRLKNESKKEPVIAQVITEADREVASLKQGIVDDDTFLIKLIIQIETTLRSIANASGLPSKVGLGQLINMMYHKEILTDKWLISALNFFREHRNELVHEGKTEDIKSAISVGKTVLAKLLEIKMQYYPELNDKI